MINSFLIKLSAISACWLFMRCTLYVNAQGDSGTVKAAPLPSEARTVSPQPAAQATKTPSAEEVPVAKGYNVQAAPFWVPPSNEWNLSQELPGWTLITDDAEIPLQFCFDTSGKVLDKNAEPDSCAFVGFGALNLESDIMFLSTDFTNAPSLVASPIAPSDFFNAPARVVPRYLDETGNQFNFLNEDNTIVPPMGSGGIPPGSGSAAGAIPPVTSPPNPGESSSAPGTTPPNPGRIPRVPVTTPPNPGAIPPVTGPANPGAIPPVTGPANPGATAPVPVTAPANPGETSPITPPEPVKTLNVADVGKRLTLVTAGSFTENCLFRVTIRSSDGSMHIADKDKKMFWHLDPASRRIDYVDEASATQFQMFRNQVGDSLIIKAGNVFVSLMSMKRSSPTDPVTGVAHGRHNILTGTFLYPPTYLPGAKKEFLQTVIDRSDAICLGIRYTILSNANGKLSAAYMAYDLALSVLVKRRLNHFTYDGATTMDLELVLSKTFTLLTEKLYGQYRVQYPSLGQHFPKAFSLYSMASSIDFKTQSPTVWQEVAGTYMKIVTDADSPAKQLGAAIFSQAVLNDIEEKTNILARQEDNIPTCMSIYYRSSCALAWRIPGISFEAKASLTQIITNRFGDKNAELYLNFPNFPEIFWFTPLLQPLENLFSTSEILVDLGLMKALNGTFLNQLNTVGKRISNPTFDAMNKIMQNSEYVDLRQVLQQFSDPRLQEPMASINAVCIQKALMLELCVLPQVHTQSIIFQTFAIVSTKNRVKDLVAGSNINYIAYFRAVQEDKAYIEIGNEVSKVSNDFLAVGKKLTADLAQLTAEAAVQMALASSVQVQKSAQNLNAYVRQASGFRTQLYRARIIQRYRMIEERMQILSQNQHGFIKKLRRIVTKASIRIQIDMVVNMVNAVFQIGDMFHSMGPNGYKDVGSIATVAAQAQKIVKDFKNLQDFEGLVKLFTALVIQMSALLQDAAKIYPQILALGETVAVLADESRNLTASDVQTLSSRFVTAYGNYFPVLGLAIINGLEAQFNGIADKMCALAQIPGDKDCVSFSSDTTLAFGSLEEIVYISDELVQMTEMFATEAVNSRTVALLQETVDEGAQAAATTEDIKEQEKKYAVDREKWAEGWMQKQRFRTAVAMIATTLNQIYLLSALFGKCDEDAYLNGGKPSPVCQNVVYTGKPISRDSIRQLNAASSSSDAGVTVTNTATIPTSPLFDGDLAYIDLAQLVRGQKHYFRLPYDASWLVEHNWLQSESDLMENVIHVTQLRLKLPPVHSRFTEERSTITITIQSTSENPLGPALKNEVYRLNPCSFKTTYTLVPQSSKSARTSDCENVEYQNCWPQWPLYCFRSNGQSEASNKLEPSLFADFSVVATFGSADEGASNLIPYESMQTPMLLYVDYTYQQYPIAAGRKNTVEDLDDTELVPPGELEAYNAAPTNIPNSTTAAPTPNGTTPTPSGTAPAPTPNGTTPTPSGTASALKPNGTAPALTPNGTTLTPNGTPAVPPPNIRNRWLSKVKLRNTCCEKGSYNSIRKGQYACLACPEGSVSFYGGLFCGLPRSNAANNPRNLRQMILQDKI